MISSRHKRQDAALDIGLGALEEKKRGNGYQQTYLRIRGRCRRDCDEGNPLSGILFPHSFLVLRDGQKGQKV
ncbi:hypothetical protein Y1Q_0022201 [Alligator mississippiensis]|uniref:Uncharacterized protein n=1 Tax=Alligator mississippiensis TaxID=8496 RepID=A0A151NZZ9_ALLMI|nr:hypothetical protein Y1Q_0022201 [Alligator mississippiensis]